MIKRVAFVLAAMGCAAGAFAYSNTITYNDLRPGGDDAVIHWFNGSGYNSEDGGCQFLEFTDNSYQSAVNDPLGLGGLGNDTAPQFLAVCADLPDNISGGSTYGIGEYNSAGVPANVGNGAKAYGYSLDYQLAGAIVGGWYYPVLNNHFNADWAAALQLATWAALYDGNIGNQSNDLFLLGGNRFFISGGSADTTNILNIATLMYDDGLANINNYNATLLVGGTISSGPYTGDVGQDQFVVGPNNNHRTTDAPEPVTMSLGLAAVGLFIRRRVKSNKV